MINNKLFLVSLQKIEVVFLTFNLQFKKSEKVGKVRF
jgi:hypothetical protein